ERVFELDIADLCLAALYAAFATQVHHALYAGHVLVIFVGWVIAQDVHIHACAFLNYRQTDSASADDRNCLAGDFVSQKREKWMPCSPAILTDQLFTRPCFTRNRTHHEERKFSRCLSKNVGRIREWDFVPVCVGAIDVVESN